MRIRCPSCKKAFSLPDSMRTGKGNCPHCGQRLDIGRMPRKGELQPGDTLGGCRIEGLLGRGGMAVVYKAVQLSLERHVALKVLPQRLARDKQFVRRFNREASALARLSHPNIVAILDKGVDHDTYYFVMEYVEGRSLQSRLQREKKLSPQETHEIMQGVCAALEYAHEHKVVHRDLKPGNILLDVNGTPKLADFGIARIIEAGTATDQRQLTMAHTVMGSADYMAPEQRTDAAKADHRADIYALGVMLYQMLTGELPVGTFRPASRLVPGLSAAVDRAIRTALAHEPDDRFSSVARFRAALNAAFSEGVSRPARRSAPTPKKRSKAVGVLATVGIMAGLAVLLVVMLSQRGKTPDRPPEGPPKKPPEKVVEPPPTKTPAKKTSTVTKEDVKGDEHEPAHVRKALARFRAFVDANPRKFQEQIEQLKDLAIRQNDPQVIKAIQAERNAVLRRLEEAIDAELAAMAARAGDLADQRKFSAAFKAYATFPNELSTQESKLKIGKAVLALKQRVSDTLDGDIQRAAGLVKAGKGPEAEALLRDTDYGAPDLRERAAAELGKLRTLLAQDAARREADAKKALTALTETLKARWADRDYPEALAAAREAQASTQAGDALAPHLAAATMLDDFWKAVLEGVELHKGRDVNIRNTTYTLEGMADGKLKLTLPVGGEITPPLKSLSVEDLLFFAGSRVDRKEPAGQLTVGLLYTYDRTPDAALANRAFAQAAEFGADKALIAAFRDLGAAATPQPETPAAVQEAPKGFALDFNGASDYVEVPDKRSRPSPLHLKRFTVEAWVWRRPGGDEVQHIVTKNAGWTNSVSFALYTHKGMWAYATGDGMSVSQRVTRTVAPFGAWVHVALVVDEGSSALFVDGQSVDRSAAPKFLGYDDQPLTIGACKVEGNMAGFWSGAIDEVRVSLGPRYQKPFTPERACKPDARTQLLLRFEEGKGTTTRDLSRYRHRAEIHGAKFLDLGTLAPPTNAVAHWSFDKLDGSIVLNETGNTYPAQIVGTVQFGQGVDGQSLVLDGTSYLLVDQGKSLALPQLTLAAWIKPADVNARTGILSKRMTAAAAPFSLLLAGGRVVFEVDTHKGAKTACTSTVAAQPGAWQHVAVTVGDSITLYVNGAPAGTARLRGAPVPNAEPLVIGRDSTGTRPRPVAQPGGYVGELDDLRIWARPLSAAEIAELAKR